MRFRPRVYFISRTRLLRDIIEYLKTKSGAAVSLIKVQTLTYFFTQLASGKNVHTGILSIMQVENNRIRIFMQYITKNIRQSSFWHTVKKVLLALVLFNKNLQINICTGNKSEQLFPIHGNNNRIQHTT